MIKRILVAVSGSADPAAKITAAIEIARKNGAAITLMSVTDTGRLKNVGPVPAGASHYANQLRRHQIAQSQASAEQSLQRFQKACEEAGVESGIVRMDGEPVENLLAAWRYHDLCLLSLRHWFDEDVIDVPPDAPLRLVASGMRPLLVIPDLYRPVKCVLVAYNGSLESAKAMKQFVHSGLWPGAVLRIVCVGSTKSGERPETALEDSVRYCAAHGREATGSRIGVGRTQNQLLAEAARVNADMIVMGSSYRRVLLSRRFGTNAAGLVKSSPLPLFLSH